MSEGELSRENIPLPSQSYRIVSCRTYRQRALLDAASATVVAVTGRSN